MAERVKVSSRYQIAVPAAARKKLGIEKGDYLLVEARDGIIVLVPEPHSYADRLLGLHREIWEGIDAQEYVNRERDSWQES
jgi:AbrB family looped-hinge helix DNA binding protein